VRIAFATLGVVRAGCSVPNIADRLLGLQVVAARRACVFDATTGRLEDPKGKPLEHVRRDSQAENPPSIVRLTPLMHAGSAVRRSRCSASERLQRSSTLRLDL
jgi:hypothetical protein